MYTNRFINTLSFIITIAIFITIESCSWIFKNSMKNITEDEVIVQNSAENSESSDEEVAESVDAQVQENIDFWKVEIPKIDLVAGICEGTTSDILAKSVGHFEETSKTEGNIGLAAHNRGYRMNFFENIKNLDIGDKIIYTYEEITREYEVEKLVIIKETDWSYLEETSDNRVTLITCVKNSPEYRLCVQGKEVTETP